MAASSIARVTAHVELLGNQGGKAEQYQLWEKMDSHPDPKVALPEGIDARAGTRLGDSLRQPWDLRRRSAPRATTRPGPVSAQLRSADRGRKCLLFGVDRTYRGNHKSDAIDPKQTNSSALELIRRGCEQGLSKPQHGNYVANSPATNCHDGQGSSPQLRSDNVTADGRDTVPLFQRKEDLRGSRRLRAAIIEDADPIEASRPMPR